MYIDTSALRLLNPIAKQLSSVLGNAALAARTFHSQNCLGMGGIRTCGLPRERPRRKVSDDSSESAGGKYAAPRLVSPVCRVALSEPTMFIRQRSFFSLMRTAQQQLSKDLAHRQLHDLCATRIQAFGMNWRSLCSI